MENTLEKGSAVTYIGEEMMSFSEMRNMSVRKAGGWVENEFKILCENFFKKDVKQKDI